MNNFEYAVITPSFAPDFERCKLLCQSMDRFISPKWKHYLIVDRRDIAIFKQLQSANREIIAVEDMLPWWIKRVPLAKRWWFSFKTLPIRNWILQQIVKISLAQYIKEDVLVFVDSDVAFIRPFSFSSFEKDGKVRLFRIPEKGNIPSHYKWHRAAGKLLGIPVSNYYGARYIGNIISWKKENVLLLHERISSVGHQDWIKILASQLHLSEYILYGVFINNILKERSGHYMDSQNICLEYWENKNLTDDEIPIFLSKICPEHVAIMISAKSNMSTDRYKKLLELASKKEF